MIRTGRGSTWSKMRGACSSGLMGGESKAWHHTVCPGIEQGGPDISRSGPSSHCRANVSST
eukprot:3800712-Alexandrium_andersonii.AAC.1